MGWERAEGTFSTRRMSLKKGVMLQSQSNSFLIRSYLIHSHLIRSYVIIPFIPIYFHLDHNSIIRLCSPHRIIIVSNDSFIYLTQGRLVIIYLT